MIIRKYLFLGILCVVISVSILVAAIVGAKHHHASKDQSSADSNTPNSIVSRAADGSFGTYSDRINNNRNPWNRTPYSAVAIFGASDCDDAHPRSSMYADTIRPAPYWQGRFTNGPVFGEYLAASTLTGKTISSLNYAYGDATVNNRFVKVNAPDTRTQMEMYAKDASDGKIDRGSSKDGRVLHCVWIGINDIIQIWTDVIKNGTFQNGNVNGHQTGFEHAVDRVKIEAKELIDQIQFLRSDSAVNQIKSDFLLLFLPPLEIVPNLRYQSRDLAHKNSTLATIYLDYIGKLTALYNNELGSGIESLQQEERRGNSKSRANRPDSFSNVNVKYFDIPKYWYFVRNNPDKYDFANVIDACWNSTTGVNCKEPARWEYYDTLHPTTKMHEYLAQEITVQVNL